MLEESRREHPQPNRECLSTTVSIMHDGERTDSSFIESRMRQGCPLLLDLFNIVLKVPPPPPPGQSHKKKEPKSAKSE